MVSNFEYGCMVYRGLSGGSRRPIKTFNELFYLRDPRGPHTFQSYLSLKWLSLNSAAISSLEPPHSTPLNFKNLPISFNFSILTPPYIHRLNRSRSSKKIVMFVWSGVQPTHPCHFILEIVTCLHTHTLLRKVSTDLNSVKVVMWMFTADFIF